MNPIKRSSLNFVLNGSMMSLQVEDCDLLIDVLRQECRMTGVKRSCDVEVCGACTVLVDELPMSSCSTLAFDIAGKSVRTIEGVGHHGMLSDVQKAFVEHGAMQCGFCTPGMVLATIALLGLNPSPSRAEIKHFLRGNICRCTGYVKIIEAIESLAVKRSVQA